MLAGRLGHGQQQIDATVAPRSNDQGGPAQPEGARALLLVTRGAMTQALVTGVVRRSDGTPVAFSSVPPLRVLERPEPRGGRSVVRRPRRRRPRQQGHDTHLYVIQAQVGGEAGQPLFISPVPDRSTGLAVSTPVDVYAVASPVDVYVRTSDGKSAAVVLGAWKPLDIRGLTLPN